MEDFFLFRRQPKFYNVFQILSLCLLYLFAALLLLEGSLENFADVDICGVKLPWQHKTSRAQHQTQI